MNDVLMGVKWSRWRGLLIGLLIRKGGGDDG
jgi:hypothetical protein